VTLAEALGVDCLAFLDAAELRVLVQDARPPVEPDDGPGG
jgi:hypothetical protein